MGNRTVHIGGDAIGTVIATGDQNTITATTKLSLPPADSVDIRAELAALRQALSALTSPDTGKMGRALADAEEEAAKPNPDRDEIGTAVERAVKYAKGAADFSKQAVKVIPHLEAISSWLGKAWDHLITTAGAGGST